MEHFLACHEHGFAAFGGVPSKIMVDKISNRRFRAAPGPALYRCSIRALSRFLCPPPRLCDRSLQMSLRGNEKGRVESGVGYVKKNFLHGLELTDFSTIHAAAQVWLDTIANLRIHGENATAPRRFVCAKSVRKASGTAQPAPLLTSLTTSTSVASSQFRITLDTNQYSVPSAYAHRRLTVKSYPDRICIYFDNQLIARHPRRYGRHEDIEDPDHAKGLIAQRSRARDQRLMMHFLALSPRCPESLLCDGLEQRKA